MTPGYSRLHFFKDRDGDLPVGESWGLIFDRNDGFRRDPDDGEDRETALVKVQRALSEQPGQSQETLAKITGVSVRTVRKAVKELGDVFDTGPNGEKLYRLPDSSTDQD